MPVEQKDLSQRQGAGTSKWRATACLVIVLIALFSVTAEWNDRSVNMDAVATALPAWSLATRGTIDLPEFALTNWWVVETPRGNFSNRPPGTWLVAVPAYWLFGDRERFSTDPSTLTAVVITALALGVLHLTLRKIMSVRQALLATLVFGLGTATWTMSSNQLWAHGTGQLTAALGMLGLASSSYVLAGVAFGYGILARPPTALFPAITGTGEAVISRGKRVRVLLAVGLPSAVSLALLGIYNQRVFGTFSIRGGYEDTFAENALGMSWSDYIANFETLLIGRNNGLLIWSPIVLPATIAAVLMWKQIPKWARFGAIAGVVYLLIHLRLNRASGGLTFGYRYPLEPLMMAAPALALATVRYVEQGGLRKAFIVGFAVLSVSMQVIYVLTFKCVPYSEELVRCTVFW